ncbi:HtaA domain-containing protein [Leucobacter luti]|uniref:Htaa protein n=1 Tax=Leucobacter luti TaxID=340320 RepID=A0A4Q7U2U5_9MICO|nr:HtaA domain-containing protein [Leucobacter luti]MBL3699555.1 hypothetical protein [Leucobacter luti]RZT67067.1 Htaa protein [Leucobacter luti]
MTATDTPAEAKSADTAGAGALIGATGTLSWAIRDSFLRYVTIIARGAVESDGVTTDEAGAFVFPLRAASHEADGWHLSFGGWVHFTAHGGFLDVLVAAPEVILGPAGGVLVTHTREPGAPLLPLTSVAPAAPDARSGQLEWGPLPTRLLAAAEDHFGNVYPADTEMASLSVALRHPIHS